MENKMVRFVVTAPAYVSEQGSDYEHPTTALDLLRMICAGQTRLRFDSNSAISIDPYPDQPETNKVIYQCLDLRQASTSISVVPLPN